MTASVILILAPTVIESIIVIVKAGLTEEEAEMYVIESNVMQRGFENLRISEQAAAVALRHSEMFSQGKRNDILRKYGLFHGVQKCIP